MLLFALAKITSCKEMDFSVVSIFVCLIAAYNCVFATGQQKCADKFLELDVIKYRAVNTSRIGYTLDNQTRILTEYQFNCSSTNITSVILGINVRLPTNNRTMFPSILLYRPGAGNITEFNYTVVDERVIYYSTSNISTSGVYEYTFDPPITATNGDVLAVHQPPRKMSIVRVSYIPNILFESRIRVTIGNNSVLERERNGQLILVYPVTDNNCINSSNLITDSIIRQNSLKIYNSSDIDGMPTQYFYPDINFSCNGTITKWIFGGTIGNGSRSPELQIWRQTDANNYVKIGSSLINISTPIFNYTNVHEFEPQPPLKFQEGDILGIYVPNKTESQLILKEQIFSGPVNFVIHNVNGPLLSSIADSSKTKSGNDFPLITAEISIDTPSITYTTVITTTVASQDIVPIDQTNTDTTMMIQAFSTFKFTTSFSIEFASSIPITSNTMFLTEGTSLTTSTSSELSEVLSTSNLSISPIISSSASPSLLVPIITSSVLIIMIAVIILVIVIAVVIIYRRHSGTKTSPMTNNIYTLNEEIVLPNPTYESSHDITDRVEEPAGRAAVSSYEILPLSHTSQPKYIVPDYQEVSREEHERATVRNVENALYEERNVLVNDVYSVVGQVPAGENNSYSTLDHFPSSSSVDESFADYWEPGSNTGSIYQQLSDKKYREITRQNIQLNKCIGSGQFGTVDQGVWFAPFGSVEVAVKTLNDETVEEEKVLFLREAAIMGQFHHPNIVKMHGVVTVGEPNMIVLELMTHGDLRQYLQQYQPIPGELAVSTIPSLLLEFSKHISSGMNYLSNKKFIHRDLAARNILVTEGGICKIGDFGMARDLRNENYYISHAKKIPVKWTAPEALNFKRYSTASDVWSYGVVLYEIWSVGHKPFENCSNQECLRQVDSGYRLPPPAGCPRLIYQLMIQCWNPDTSGRPSFSDIQQCLNQLDISQCNIGGLGGPVDSSPYADLQNMYT